MGSQKVRDFIGGLDTKGLTKGVLITTSDFTNESCRQVDDNKSKKIVLINGKKLAEYMYEYDMGVSTTAEFKIKDIASEYFDEDQFDTR